MPSTTTSPFLHPGPLTTPSTLSILHLKRDLLLPTIVLPASGPNDGYAEGPVTNTRFGSFPHSTLLDIPWGSQVRASFVDTGSRGRKRKRSPDPSYENNIPQQHNASPNTCPPNINHSTPHHHPDAKPQKKRSSEPPSGYIHILPPTPETWTLGLPHRTQVVYTPDYSYILHRLRARPGTRLIEAGAGSGSFTHAAARAVYGPSSSPRSSSSLTAGPTPADDEGKKPTWGHIHSYEFHSPRHSTLSAELASHGLDPLITLSLRDVCTSGFLGTESASCIFLDLPAPWLALPHLSRRMPGVLDPTRAVRICTFSPCIEQVHRTIASLRRMEWVEIEMCGIAAKKVEVRRERVGVAFGGRRGEKGVSAHPASVREAVGRGREVEERGRRWHERQVMGAERDAEEKEAPVVMKEEEEEHLEMKKPGEEGNTVPGYYEGRLVTRSEAEIKEHTSYLVFAVLPMAWTEEDERRAAERVAGMAKGVDEGKEMSRAMGKKARKRAAKEAAAGKNKGEEAEAVGEVVKAEGEGAVEQAVENVKRDEVLSVGAGEDVKMEEADH
ncbi:MAG: tRNA (adenine-N(1)-)-methyltransferase catalytic subunit trm61 [Ramalina farinacea]|uniref:tRNA (adenine(58)-N(1))-methyltransferase catalytic subunit TRM61 n=1 Tax=Ramalina farinacea TaxID=258253 RepID=A0AA43TVE6_9LECA|nr:tRNA (adenine-N(1)-)-methyltransferase catalytic subunit trm61 [Ramalina farinacea]